MKQVVAAVFISGLALVTFIECGATDPGDSSSQEGIAFLEFSRRSIQIFRKSFVVGTVKVEEQGFRFVPAMVSPDGFESQERFEREFWYNPLFNDLYIPFTNLLKIKHSGKVVTKDCKMYMIRSNDHEYWHKVYNEIRKAIPPPDTVKREKRKGKFMEVLWPPKDDVAFLELYRRGSMHFYNRTLSMGKVKLDEDGLRFIPMIQGPPGYSHQEMFSKVYWYNPLMEELYMPFSEMESLKRKKYFRMNDGRKYILFGVRRKHWNPIVKEVKANIQD